MPAAFLTASQQDDPKGVLIIYDRFYVMKLIGYPNCDGKLTLPDRSSPDC